ncbi:hypothetical protein LY78DRAFT_652368 [Colletotrichum sublineola]|nr:hypothetical protein LY78DRAFT_652368 [Colletotrichum sublineola]
MPFAVVLWTPPLHLPSASVPTWQVSYAGKTRTEAKQVKFSVAASRLGGVSHTLIFCRTPWTDRQLRNLLVIRMDLSRFVA